MFEKQIAAGARELDENRPGWFRQIDTETLDLAKCENCIVGQLCGQETIREIVNSGFNVSCEYGFNVPQHADFSFKEAAERMEKFRVLTSEWKQYIRGRIVMDDALKALNGEGVSESALRGE